MQNPAPDTICPACGGSNQCAMASNSAATDCWCMRKCVRLPLPDLSATSCYCPACLQKILQEQQERRLLT